MSRYRILGLLTGLIATALVVVYTMRALDGHDLTVYATPKAIGAIGLAALCWMMVVPLMALAWRGMLAGLKVHKSWRELTAILGITQFAKYVPGNVLQYLGRAGMCLSRGINARAFAATVVPETLLMIGAALTVGVGTGSFSAVGTLVVRRHHEQLTLIVTLLVVAALILVIGGKFAPRLLQRLAPRYADLLAGKLLPPRVRMLGAFSLYCAMYFCTGIGLAALAHLLLPGIAQDYWLLIASFSLAWVVGFVTPGAPGGFGVREGLLLLMLAPVYTPVAASILVIALRIATTAGDSFSFAIGLLILPRTKGGAKSESAAC